VVFLSMGRRFPFIVGIQTGNTAEMAVVFAVGSLIPYYDWRTAGIAGI
jgi:hypothetical protein